jgi:RNA polymerase sigma-70 factor (ECF subfamily)
MCNEPALRYTSPSKGVRYADGTLSDISRVSNPSDADLARRLAGGDREAEAELFRRLSPRVRLYGLRHLRDAAAADDLVQDVMLTTFDGLREGRVREPELLASFVLGTCRRVVAGLRRGAERRRRILERHGRELVPSAAEGSQLDLAHLARCLAALSERERSVVVLTFYADRRADDIATELGMNGGNVRVVRHRALARLRACVGGES